MRRDIVVGCIKIQKAVLCEIPRCIDDVLGGNDPSARQNFQIALDGMKQIPGRAAVLEIELTDEQAGAIRQELQSQRAGQREWFFNINDKAFLRQFGVDVPA